MFVTLFGIFTEVSLVQLENPELPIEVTLLGIATELNFTHA